VTIVVRRIEPGIVRLELSSWRGRAVGYKVSAYMMHDVLVDTGFPGVREELVRAVRALKPRGVVVTHWHEDHAGNVPGLDALGLPMRMHAGCVAMLRARPAIRPYRRIVWGRTGRVSWPFKRFDPAPLEIIETPGHTDDHVAVWDAERRILASGDLFLGVKVRVAHLHESPRALLASLRLVAALEPRILLDPHRGVVEHATNRLHAKIDWMEEMIGEIQTLAAKGCSEREIQRRVLGREAFVGRMSFGEYSKRSLVRAVLREAEMPERGADPSTRSARSG
jgi:glyoxylase-like metal-dependent hydrolase (beta-lactamase superfamily II)